MGTAMCVCVESRDCEEGFLPSTLTYSSDYKTKSYISTTDDRFDCEKDADLTDFLMGARESSHSSQDDFLKIF